jgi:hypothetical protein
MSLILDRSAELSDGLFIVNHFVFTFNLVTQMYVTNAIGLYLLKCQEASYFVRPVCIVDGIWHRVFVTTLKANPFVAADHVIDK